MFFNVIASPGLGERKDILNEDTCLYGQANISINANPLNGNLFVKDFTKSFTEQGFSFDVGYQYNSQSNTPWQLNQGKSIGPIQGSPNTAGSYVIVKESDGHESTYSYNAERDCYVNTSETGGASVLKYSQDGQWTGWNPASNRRESYNKNNQLEKLIDDSGNFLSYEYDSLGRLIAINGSSGPKVGIEYTGQTTSIYSLDGNKKTLVTKYLFNDKNQLQKTLIPVNEKEIYEINYGYSNTSGLLESIKQSDGTAVTFAYEHHKLTHIVNGVGNEFQLSYGTDTTLLTDPLGNRKLFTQNKAGLLKKYTDNDQTQEYIYDEMNRLESIQYQDDSNQRFSYDTLGFHSKLTNRTGGETLYRHDKQTGLLLCETEVDNGKHLNTFYIYNDKKELVFKVLPNGAVHAYGHDSHGNCIRETVYLNTFFDVSALTKDSTIPPSTIAIWCSQQNKTQVALTEWTYNAQGKKTSETLFASIDKDGKGIHDASTAYQEFEWSIHGELQSKKTKLNEQETATESVRYDGLSRSVQEINALGHKTLHSYQNNKHQTTFVPTGLVSTVHKDSGDTVIQKEDACDGMVRKDNYVHDKAGRPCIIEKENGQKEFVVYDKYNRVLFSIDSLLNAVKYSYDENNNLLHKTSYQTPLAQVNEHALKQGTWVPQPTGDCCVETTFYDADGRLLCTIDGDNFVTKHRYNALGNRIETTVYAKPLTPEQRNTCRTVPEKIDESTQDRHHRYFYDDANQLIAEQNPLGQVIAYERNAQGDLLRRVETLGSLPQLLKWDATVISGVPQKIETFQLDARGQCLKHINAEQIATNKVWDAGGRVVESECGGETQLSKWDFLNRLVKESHSSGLDRTKSYAPCGKLASDTQVDKIAGSQPRSNYFRYNGFGQITHELTPRAALKLNDPIFAKDSALVEALWQNESIRHHYSATGLKLSTQDELGNTSYFYYNNAQELCFTVSPTGSITEYTYDGIFHQCDSTRFYENCLDAKSLALLKGGLLTPELIALFQSQQIEKDAIERVRFNKRGLISLSLDAEQFSEEKHYDAFKNLTVLKQQIDARNELVSRLEYDKANRPVTKIQDADGIAATEKWNYVDAQNLVEYTDANHNKHKTQFDNIGRKIKETNGLGVDTSFAWDSLSRLKQIVDGLGNITKIDYENHGRTRISTSALSRSVIEKNAFGEIEAEQNADGERKQSIYDVDGQIKTTIDPDGHQNNFRYNLAGWLIELIDPLNKMTRYQHNRNGQIERQIEVGLNEERVVVLKRDAQGRELLRIDANGITTQTLYDKRGLEIGKLIDPKGLDLGTYSKFDGLGNLIETIKGSSQYPSQYVTQLIRDKTGRIIKKIVDPEGLKLTTSMSYDDVGNCIAITDPNQHSSHFCYDSEHFERYIIDPMGGVIGKLYNANGQCIEERHYSTPINSSEISDFSMGNIEKLVSASDDDKVLYYAYDSDNRRIASLDSNGKLTQYKYNAQGKKTQEISFATPVTKAEFMVKTPKASSKDRQLAWFYDGSGNERFTINGEGIITEQRWNAKGWLIEERIYETPYFDYDHCPSDEKLAAQDYRATHYIHDTYGRVVFEIDAEGYVTEYGYSQGDKPTTNWFYPEKIALPHSLTPSSIRELLPAKDKIPCTHVEYDAANRKVAAVDQLKYREVFKLDALDNLREYIDKGADSWLFDVDAMGRKTAESTPPVEITSVTPEGKLINPTGKQRVTKKMEYIGDIQRITEAYGTQDARTVELHQNFNNQTVKVVQQNVSVHDKSRSPTHAARPDTAKTLISKTIYNRFQKPIVLIDEAGNLQFKIYKGDKLLYEIDQEGFVTAYDYNVFGNVVKLTRYAEAIHLDLMAFARTGIPLASLVESLKPSAQDRRIFFEFDNANRPTKVTQDDIFVYIPQKDGEAQCGDSAPVSKNQYTAYGEIGSKHELVDPFNQKWDVTRTWFNKSGHVIAEVDGSNYVTLFEPDRYGNNTKIIEFAKPLKAPLQARCSIEELLQQIDIDEENDREYTNEINARGEVVKTLQHHVRLYDPKLDVRAIKHPALAADKQILEHQFEYNAKGYKVKEVYPNGSQRITVHDARNLPVLKTKVARKLGGAYATPVTTIGYNAFAQPARLTRHENPYEEKAYLKASDEDQTQLTGYDSRGLQIISVDPEGAVYLQSFTETKKLALSWILVSGWNDNATLIRRMHQAQYGYDKRGIENRRCESIENGSSVITTTRSNAFGEKIAEGSGDDKYPVYWLRDKSGAVWNTNETSGVPVITLRDARGQDTLILKSRTQPLQEVTTFGKLKELLNLDYRDLQRLELERNIKGAIEVQRLPAFKTLKTDAPEPLYTAVSNGRSYPTFGKVSLSWPTPDIAGLESEVLVWPKGRTDECKSFTVIKNGTRCGIDVSMLTTDDYQYQIDFYYRDPQNGQRDGSPRYRAEGSALVITDVAAINNLIWQQIDDQQVMLYGNLGDVSGIELMQGGVSAGRVAISSTDKPNCWLIDLSDKPSGRYEFHLLRGYSLLEDKPIKMGVPTSKGTRIDDITTQFSQTTDLHTVTLNTAVNSSWNTLPPGLSNAYQELTVINAHMTLNGFTALTTYETPQPHLLGINTGTSGSSKLDNYNSRPSTAPAALRPFPLFNSFSISRNRILTIDGNNQQHTIVEGGNTNAQSRFVYVQPGAGLFKADALREHFPDGHLGKTIALSKWMNQTTRCPSSLVNHSAGYDLISLQTTVPDPVPLGNVTIHTANMRSKQLIVREIALTKTMVSKVRPNFSHLGNSYEYKERNALNFKWTLPGFLESSPVKVNFQLRFNNQFYKLQYGERYSFEYIVGKANHTPYNGHLLPYPGLSKPAFSDFDLNYLNLYVQYNGDWIPLLHSDSFTVNKSEQTSSFSTSSQISFIMGSLTETITGYKEADVATFQDTYTLVFYPLPADINKNTIQLEYCDDSLPIPQWRSIADAQYTGHTIVAPANAIQPGTYQFRLKAKNIHGAAIDFSELAEPSSDGWAIGQFTVTHGGALTAVSHSKPSQEVLRPVYKQTSDRWGNILSSTDPLGNTTNTIYNGRNKPLCKTDPQIEITEANGSVKDINPQTHTVYDLGDYVIAVSDPNHHMTQHERDYDGIALKTTLADGVFKRFIPDIFGRTKSVIDPFNHSVKYRHDRCNREVLREDEYHWKTGFGHNELGDRLSVTRGPNSNGQLETERFDFLHPSRQATHHYLPGGNQTLRSYERHGVLIKELLADLRQNTWAVDDFGNIRAHIDLSGAQYLYTRNPFCPTEVLQTKGINGQNHGSRMLADGSSHPMADQDLKYQYDEASHVVGILDNAMPLTTLYRYDLNERRARDTFVASDGHIHQAVLMKWNALSWLVEVQDTVMHAKYGFDLKGNRRVTRASAFWDGNWSPIYEKWFTYTAADNMEIYKGVLKEGVIQIAPDCGTKLLYDMGGRREHEVTITNGGTTVNKSLFYFDNNLLKRTQSTSGDFAEYLYDGQIARRKIWTTKDRRQEYDYTLNGWVWSESYRDDSKKMTSSTKFTLNTLGAPTTQTTEVISMDRTDGYTDTVDTKYIGFDTDKVSEVTGLIQRKGGGQDKSSTKVFFNPNGDIETVIGKNQDPRHLITNSQGRIVKKTIGRDKEQFYFYTTSGALLGSFGNIPIEGLVRALLNCDFDLNYHPVNEHFPQLTPSTYLVLIGDTFLSISEEVYRDISFANLIADTNGYHVVDKPAPGLTLHIPNIVNTNVHNWQGQYPMYNPAAIIGGLYPNMPIPGRPMERHKHKFWHVLVEAIAGALIMAFAPELATTLSAVFGELLGELLGFAVAGAASNLAQQELAVQFGDLRKISLNSIGQSALLSAATAGIAKGLGADLMKSSRYQDLIQSATKNIELAIATQALSFATGQQRHFDWRIMLASITNALANVGAKHIDMGGQLFNDALATASSSVASIGVDKLYGTHLSSEDIAANALGTFIGNQLAAQAKQHYKDYQDKKAYNAEFQRSQIPELSEALASNKQAFIQSVLEHPHAHGTAPTPTSTQGRAHPSSTRADRANHLKPKTPPAQKMPPQEHLETERAKQEELLSHSPQRIMKHSRTQSQQPHASQHGFWAKVDELANSNLITTINEAGDRVARALDMFNPVTIVKETIADSKETVQAYRSGHIVRGMAYTGKTSLDAISAIPFAGSIVGGVKFGVKGFSAVVSKLGFFGRRAALEKTVSKSSVSEAAGRLQLEKLRTQYRQKASWVDPKEITNDSLKEVVSNLYRTNAKIGSGSSADAVRFELNNLGTKVSGKLHSQKVSDSINSLERLIKSGKLNAHERMIAENIRLDMLDSIGEKLWYSQTVTPRF